MDTIHDLGGREGFGPVRWREDDDDRPFHEPWQARTWAICMLTWNQLKQDETGWTKDWFRHVIERIPPGDYLTMNYFEKWVQSMMVTLVDDGVAEIQEFVDGHSRGKLPVRVPSPLTASAEPGPAMYAAGDTVRTKSKIASMHTRLPGYARGRKGVIDSCVGTEILADASAFGDVRKEQLYVVRFESAELWPESERRGVGIYLDLWESYLEPA